MNCIWHVNGYGVCVDKLEFSLEKLKKLILQAPNFEKELEEYFKGREIINPTMENYFEYDEDNGSGIAYILQRTINEAENIELCIAEDHNEGWYLMLCPSYPWHNWSSEVRNLTEDALEMIIMKYISILSKQELIFGYYSVECC